MTDHDFALLELLREELTSHVVDADDPDALADALVDDGARSLPPEAVPGWVVEAQLLRSRAEAVLAAEGVVARAVASEQARRLALVSDASREQAVAPTPAPPTDDTDDADDDGDDGPDADRNAVRFALVVLAFAQLGGAAVYLADGLLLAAALPAISIVGVLAVALGHRTPRPAPAVTAQPQPEPQPDPELDVVRAPAIGAIRAAPGEGPGEELVSPVVRAAEAHLRRQVAAWKVAWWERELPPADVGTWLGGTGTSTPATLVVVDAERRVDADLYASMTAALPAAVRLVLVRRRAA